MAVTLDGRALQEEREQMQAEGFSSASFQEMQPRAAWYKPDGTPVWPEGQKGPADPYHMNLFRAKGWTLAPPAVIEKNLANIEAKRMRSGLLDMSPAKPEDHPFLAQIVKDQRDGHQTVGPPGDPDAPPMPPPNTETKEPEAPVNEEHE